jgi:hypothetical protein
MLLFIFPRNRVAKLNPMVLDSLLVAYTVEIFESASMDECSSYRDWAQIA